MNFKTTVVLIGLLALAFGALWFTRTKDADRAAAGGAGGDSKAEKLFDLAAGDVNKLVVAAADGKRLAVEKAGAKWRMLEPTTAPAEAFEVDTLVRTFTDLESRGDVESDSAGPEATGLARPAYTVDLTAGGKTHTLLVGRKPAVGDIVYVSRKDAAGDTKVVSADLLARLEKPATDYRDKKLIDTMLDNVRQITLEKPGSPRIVVARAANGADWKITEPSNMPAEKSDIDDILFGLTGLRAVEFVSETSADAAAYDLDTPRITATLSGVAPPNPHAFVATAPATGPATSAASRPAPIVIKFGRYDDVLMKNVMVQTSQSPAVAKVAATVLQTINKKPIELRDKKVLDLDAAQVSAITISSELAATTRPTSRPASTTQIVLKRRKETATTAPAPDVASASAAPATAPSSAPAAGPATQASSTQPATTQLATTQAAKPQAATQPLTKWQVVVGDVAKDADDAKVDTLLGDLDPLTVQKYLETAPTTQPTATYVVRITTEGPGGTPVNQYELRLIDPGNTRPLNGTYNGLSFEADRVLADRLSGDFLKGSASAAPAGRPPFGGPGGFGAGGAANDLTDEPHAPHAPGQ